MKRFFLPLMLILFSFSCNAEILTSKHLDEVIAGKDSMTFVGKIFNVDNLQDINLYFTRLISDTISNCVYEYGLSYDRGLFLILVEFSEDKEKISDMVFIQKKTENARLASGPVEVNGTYFDWSIIVVVNDTWSGEYTDNISAAFKSNPEKMQIEKVDYETIRLYSEE